MDGPSTLAGTRRFWLLVVPVGLAALLVVSVFPDEEQLGGFAFLRWRVWAIPSALVLLALVALAAIRTPVRRVTFAVLLIILALLSLTLGLVAASTFGGREELYRVASADGPGEVVVYRGGGVTFDPPWRLELRWGSGLTERRWDLGCASSELGPPPEVEWISRDKLRLGDVFEVELDDSIGRPHDRLSIGC
jgi:hypothetical protein